MSHYSSLKFTGDIPYPQNNHTKMASPPQEGQTMA